MEERICESLWLSEWKIGYVNRPTWIVAEKTSCTTEVLPCESRIVFIVLSKHVIQLFRPSDPVQHFSRWKTSTSQRADHGESYMFTRNETDRSKLEIIKRLCWRYIRTLKGKGDWAINILWPSWLHSAAKCRRCVVYIVTCSGENNRLHKKNRP